MRGFVYMTQTKILITDSSHFDPFAMAANLQQGDIVILRDYELEPQKRHNLALALRKLTRQKGLIFLVAKTPELAKQVNADGIHLPEFMISSARQIRAKHPNWLISCASHNFRASVRAKNASADIILISPVFASPSDPKKKPLGIYKAKNMALRGIFCACLGGVNKKTTKKIKNNIFQGLAGVSWGQKRGRIAT